MKKINILCAFTIVFIHHINAQNTTITKINKWLNDNNFALRQTFDGSKNENKPASFSYQENHLNSLKDFFNADVAIKLSQFEALKNKDAVLLFYPKIEWHKSSDLNDLKNKLEGGINIEYLPFGLKTPNINSNLPNGRYIISPYFIGNSSFKRNIITSVFETKLSLQVSLASNYKFLPGSTFRIKNDKFIARYYPYLGIEYNHIPNLITKGETTSFSAYYIRLFAEIWLIPQTLQVNLDGTYREIINNSTTIKTTLPTFTGSIFLYPGKQESFGLGYEYKHGYDNSGTYQLIQISSLKLFWKI